MTPPQLKEQLNAEWEQSLVAAETYWFQIPEATRQQYAGRVIALLRDRTLDSDMKLRDLRARIAVQHPNQPILYLDADAEQDQALLLRSPRLR